MSDAKNNPSPKPNPTTGKSAGYFGEISKAAKSIVEGMAITFAELTRAPHNTTTVQYPDRTPMPVVDSLPERYRGFLEVDLDTCTGCKACERDCPINVIAIDLEKIGTERMLTRFDIDMGKCMYCGICVESCPVEVTAPGDAEHTKCIRMTREFEGATSDFNALTFRFIRPGEPVPPFKPKKGEVPGSPRRGEIARVVRAKAAEWNPLAAKWALEQRAPSLPPDAAELLKDEVVLARAKELEPIAKNVASDAAKDTEALTGLYLNQVLAQTDAGTCGYANCREYAQALATGKDSNPGKCGPGGAQSHRDGVLVQLLVAGKPAEEAAKEAIAAVTARLHQQEKSGK